LFEGLVGGKHDGSLFIASANDLEEQIGPMLVDGQIAQFVQDQQAGFEVALEFGLESLCRLCCAQGIDHVHGAGEEHRIAFHACTLTQGAGQVGFTQAHPAQEDDVGVVL
jgi:hypothetical protein